MFKQYLKADYSNSSGFAEGGKILAASLCLQAILHTKREFPESVSQIKYLYINADIFGTFLMCNDVELHEEEVTQIVKTSLRNSGDVTL